MMPALEQLETRLHAWCQLCSSKRHACTHDASSAAATDTPARMMPALERLQTSSSAGRDTSARMMPALQRLQTHLYKWCQFCSGYRHACTNDASSAAATNTSARMMPALQRLQTRLHVHLRSLSSALVVRRESLQLRRTTLNRQVGTNIAWKLNKSTKDKHRLITLAKPSCGAFVNSIWDCSQPHLYKGKAINTMLVSTAMKHCS